MSNNKAHIHNQEYAIPYHWCLTGFYKYLYEAKFVFCRPFFKQNDTVLDLGGGDGKMSALSASYVKEIWCVDENPRALRFGELLAEGIGNLHFKESSADKIPFPDAFFDKVLFMEVLEHIPQEEVSAAFKEIKRVLKPGGMLLLSTPNKRNLRARIWGERNLPEKHACEYELAEITKLLAHSGFTARSTCGVYLPLPIPKAEHWANVVPFRGLFRQLVKMGERFPTLADTILVAAEK